MEHFDAGATAARLPYPELAQSIAALLLRWRDGLVSVPERIIIDLPDNGKLLVMPAADDTLAITKVVTVHPGNPARDLPTIQGEVTVMRANTGERLGLLEGATVTGRRTAALSLLAAQRLAPNPHAPLLVMGAGVQAKAHLEAFRAGLGTERVFVVSRTPARAESLVAHARSLGMDATVVVEPAEALQDAKLIVTATTSLEPILNEELTEDAMVCAVGAFRADMAELSHALIARSSVVVDTLGGARAEAGDLIQAANEQLWDWQQVHLLADLIAKPDMRKLQGPIIFKSVGHALFDIAAAHLAFDVSAGW